MLLDLEIPLNKAAAAARAKSGPIRTGRVLQLLVGLKLFFV
jgi:hypothetical protein